MSGLRPWDDVQVRLAGLPQERRAVFALACAQHLMDVGGSDPDPALRVALEEGWSVVLGGGGDLDARRQLLCQRDDLDEDGVATLVWALGAVLGSAGDASWAARRAADAAFEGVPYPAGESAFRPLHVDARELGVQRELARQEGVLALLEGEDHQMSAIVPRLRS